MDEAKLIVELVDRSGAPGAASTSPIVPGSANIPGSTIAQDFQQQVTEQGVAPPPDQPQAPSPTSSVVHDLHSQITNAGAGAKQGAGSSSIVTSTDPLLAATRSILEASPTTTSEELQKAFGIPSARAEALLGAVRQPATASDTATLPSDTTDRPIVLEDPNFQKPIILEDPELTGRRRWREAPEKPILLTPVDDSIIDLKPIEETPFERGQRLSRQRRIESSVQAAADLIGSASSAAGNAAGGEAGQVISGLGGSIARTVGQAAPLVNTAIELAPTVNAALGTGSSATGVGAGAAGIGGVGLAGAVAAVPLAIGAVAVGVQAVATGIEVNEFNRARERIGNFSPEVAQAEAEALVRDINSRLRTAGRLGDETATLIRERSELAEVFSELRDIIGEPLLKDLATSITGLTVVLTGVKAILENSPIIKGANWIADARHRMWERIQAAVDKFLGVEKKLDHNDPFLFFKNLEHLPRPPEFEPTGTINTKGEFDPISGLKL